MAGSTQPEMRAQFWFDPICPWAWITSRWMLEVERTRSVVTEWRLMSLAYLNLVQHGGEGFSEEYLRRMVWGPVRVCAAAATREGPEILGPLYTALGTRFHDQGRRADPSAVVDALAELGLESLVPAAQSEEFDESIKRSHHEAFDQVGTDVGTPVIRVGGTAFFGPVMSPAVRGDAAGRLWDAFVTIARTDGVFEIKRTRDREPIFDATARSES